MAQIRANGLHLEYLTQGDPGKPTILLIMGLGTQLTGWPDALCDDLVDLGYHVLRFDNRDIGLSQRIEAPAPNVPLVAGMRAVGLSPRVPYTLEGIEG